MTDCAIIVKSTLAVCVCNVHVYVLLDSHLSQSKSRRMAAEAAERARVEREGRVVLRLKMADLFAKRDRISAKMETPTDNIRGDTNILTTNSRV